MLTTKATRGWSAFKVGKTQSEAPGGSPTGGPIDDLPMDRLRNCEPTLVISAIPGQTARS